MPKRMAKFQVSSELICQALALPDEIKLRDIVMDNYNPDVYVFFVEHPELQEVHEDQVIPEVSPVFTTNYDDRPATWTSFSWGDLS